MGWWKLETTKEGHITEADILHIAEMIKEGYTEGELVEDE
jgi:hypothetical protein